MNFGELSNYFLANQNQMRKKHWYRVSHKEDKGNVELLNSFFSNAVKHFKFPKGSDSNPLAEFISHPIFKVMLKYKNHPSIIAIKNTRNGSGFSFCAYSY